ncbi:MAG TPA: hypothetical protein VFJ67_05690 [Thermodesulfobacteriota bacterium]|nr:hypothetical protein [Thermodesulfobacteriota bacterium]
MPDQKGRKDLKANRDLPVMKGKQVSSLHLRKRRAQTARTAGRKSKSVSTPITTACWTRQKFQTHITHATASRVCKALRETRDRRVQQGLKDRREFKVTPDQQGHRVIRVRREYRVMPGNRDHKVCKVMWDQQGHKVRRVIRARTDSQV